MKIIQVVNYSLRICPEGVTHLDKKLLQKPNSDFGDSNFLDKGYSSQVQKTKDTFSVSFSLPLSFSSSILLYPL